MQGIHAVRYLSALPVAAVLMIVVVGCGGGGSSSTQAGSKSSGTKTSPTSQSSSSSASGSTTASAQTDCKPHYIEGETGDEVAESVASLYDCMVSRPVAGNRPELEEYGRYILGAEEFAVDGFTHISSILTLSEALSGLYEANDEATAHISIECQSTGANEAFTTIALGETQTNEGFPYEAVNGAAPAEYTRYAILPTTPKIASFSGGGNEEIWVIEEEAVLGPGGETYPTEGSCQRPLDRSHPVKPTYADNSLPTI